MQLFTVNYTVKINIHIYCWYMDKLEPATLANFSSLLISKVSQWWFCLFVWCHYLFIYYSKVSIHLIETCQQKSLIELLFESREYRLRTRDQTNLFISSKIKAWCEPLSNTQYPFLSLSFFFSLYVYWWEIILQFT